MVFGEIRIPTAGGDVRVQMTDKGWQSDHEHLAKTLDRIHPVEFASWMPRPWQPLLQRVSAEFGGTIVSSAPPRPETSGLIH